MFLDHYVSVGSLRDLDEAIDAFRQAVDTLAPPSPGWRRLLSRLGGSLRNRYKASGSLADLEEAIAVHRRVIEEESPGSAERPLYFHALSEVLRDRYDRSGDIQDLDEAIAASARQLRPCLEDRLTGQASSIAWA